MNWFILRIEWIKKGGVYQDLYEDTGWPLGTSRRRHSRDRVYYMFKKHFPKCQKEGSGGRVKREIRTKIF